MRPICVKSVRKAENLRKSEIPGGEEPGISFSCECSRMARKMYGRAFGEVK